MPVVHSIPITVLLFIHFPRQHPDLAQYTLPGEIKFLDPGLHNPDADTRYWHPEELPLSVRESRRYLNECLRFGDQFASASELAMYAGRRMEDFYSGSVPDIKSELRSRSRGQTEQQDASGPRVKAQMLLVLNWSLEEKLIELAALEERVSSNWRQFDAALGIEQEDSDIKLPLWADSNRSASLQELDWKRLVPPFLELMPEDASLFVSEPGIVREWLERGIVFTATAGDQGKMPFEPFELPAGIGLYRAQVNGLKLAGMKEGASAFYPWHEREWTVYGYLDDVPE